MRGNRREKARKRQESVNLFCVFRSLLGSEKLQIGVVTLKFEESLDRMNRINKAELALFY